MVDSRASVVATGTALEPISQPRDPVAKGERPICRNHLHGVCSQYYICHRRHVPREDWSKYYSREEICPKGPEKCPMRKCSFKAFLQSQQTQNGLGADIVGEGSTTPPRVPDGPSEKSNQISANLIHTRAPTEAKTTASIPATVMPAPLRGEPTTTATENRPKSQPLTQSQCPASQALPTTETRTIVAEPGPTTQISKLDNSLNKSISTAVPTIAHKPVVQPSGKVSAPKQPPSNVAPRRGKTGTSSTHQPSVHPLLKKTETTPHPPSQPPPALPTSEKKISPPTPPKKPEAGTHLPQQAATVPPPSTGKADGSFPPKKPEVHALSLSRPSPSKNEAKAPPLSNKPQATTALAPQPSPNLPHDKCKLGSSPLSKKPEAASRSSPPVATVPPSKQEKVGVSSVPQKPQVTQLPPPQPSPDSPHNKHKPGVSGHPKKPGTVARPPSGLPPKEGEVGKSSCPKKPEASPSTNPPPAKIETSAPSPAQQPSSSPSMGRSKESNAKEKVALKLVPPQDQPRRSPPKIGKVENHRSSEVVAERTESKQQSNPDIDRLIQKLEKSIENTTTPVTDCVATPQNESSAAREAPSVPPGLGLDPGHKAGEPPPEGGLITTTLFHASRVTFGPGYKVHSLMTGFESRVIIIKNVPTRVTSDAVKRVLEPFGEVTAVQIPEYKKEHHMIVKATFANYVEAGTAAAALDGATLFGSEIEVSLNTTSTGKAIARDGDVCLEFPPPTQVGFAGYASRAQADSAIVRAQAESVIGEIFEGLPRVGGVTVRFRGLAVGLTPTDLERFGETEGAMIGNINYYRLESALNRLYDRLDQFGHLEKLDVLPPPYVKGFVRAWAHFKNPQAADLACAALDNTPQRCIGNETLFARHERSLTYRLPLTIFHALAPDIRYLRYCAYTYDNRCNIVLKGTTDTVAILRLLADKAEILLRLKKSFEQLLRGDVITQGGNIVWNHYFTRPGGVAFLSGLRSQYSNVIIDTNIRTRHIALFGPPGPKVRVRGAILLRVRELRSRSWQKFNVKEDIIGLFMSADLTKLIQELGGDNVIFDLAERTLTIRGDEEAFQVARLAILNAEKRLRTGKHKTNDMSCPVCFDEASSPVSLECGHRWCKSCLSRYILASVDNGVFPLKCLGDAARCPQHITLRVCRELLSPSENLAVMQASYLSYVHHHPAEFHSCPTPDCPQIYRSVPKGTILRCPSCLIRICADCHKERHEGLCRYTETQDMKLFQEWIKEHDVKKCPGCKAPIERAAGCNHMTCTRCKTHICWVCMAKFDTGGRVYDHMHAEHGGIGL